MKKLYVLLAIVWVSAALTACGTDSGQAVMPEQSNETKPEAMEMAEETAVLAENSTVQEKEEKNQEPLDISDTDDTPPVFYEPIQTLVTEVDAVGWAGDFSYEFLELAGGAENQYPLLQKALEEYREDVERTGAGYGDSLHIIQSRSDTKAVSFYAYWDSTSNYHYGHTFETESGKEVAFYEIVTDTEEFGEILYGQLLYYEMQGLIHLGEGWEEEFSTLLQMNLERDAAWYLSGNSIYVYLQDSSYFEWEDGIPLELEVYYDEARDCLAPDWFYLMSEYAAARIKEPVKEDLEWEALVDDITDKYDYYNIFGHLKEVGFEGGWTDEYWTGYYEGYEEYPLEIRQAAADESEPQDDSGVSAKQVYRTFYYIDGELCKVFVGSPQGDEAAYYYREGRLTCYTNYNEGVRYCGWDMEPWIERGEYFYEKGVELCNQSYCTWD